MALDLQKATQKPVISFILASSSPRRKELLSDLIQDFYVKNAEVNELDIHPDGPKYLVLENAKLKCEEIAKSFPDFWVLGADTLVALGSKIFSKPKDLQEAKAILMQLSGKTHKVFTGVSLINISKDINLEKSISTSVTFRSLDERIIDAYFSKVNPLDKAGAYGIQASSEMIVDSYRGSLSNVIGLPTELLQQWFEKYDLV